MAAGSTLKHLDDAFRQKGNVVTQITSNTTGVTINARSGQITTATQDVAAGTEDSFTVTNNQVDVRDVPVLAVQSNTVSEDPSLSVTAVADGSFEITITNLSGSTLDGVLVINFILFKA